jgi:3-phosphoshikimate 1-carboxyvinyltransferase
VTQAPASATVVSAARLTGRLRLPADKSIAHRALVIGALSGGPTTVEIRNPGDDVLSTVACLRALGVEVLAEEGRYVISGHPSRDALLDCGNSGTSMRLLAGAVAGLPLRVTLDGDASLRARPMERVAELLRGAGADVTTTDGHAPMTVVGRQHLTPTSHRLTVASAQLLAAAALAGLSAEGETVIETPGPTRDHTERLLAWTGVPIRREGFVTSLSGPATPLPFELSVPGDPSAAAAWLVAGAVHPDADIVMEGVGINPTRLALVGLLRRMGADINVTATDEAGPELVGEISVRSGRPLRGVSIGEDEVAELIDELPLVAIAMASCEDESEVRGAGELRVKESDRIATVAAGLAAIGASVQELPDGWRIRGGSPREARIATHGDHRIAIAFAVAALSGVASSVELDDPACVAVSYPTFWSDLATVAS